MLDVVPDSSQVGQVTVLGKRCILKTWNSSDLINFYFHYFYFIS